MLEASSRIQLGVRQVWLSNIKDINFQYKVMTSNFYQQILSADKQFKMTSKTIKRSEKVNMVFLLWLVDHINWRNMSIKQMRYCTCSALEMGYQL